MKVEGRRAHAVRKQVALRAQQRLAVGEREPEPVHDRG
jgi:hypothetical protein